MKKKKAPKKSAVLKVICCRTGKYTGFWRHVRAFFSPEILQAGAVKRLSLHAVYIPEVMTLKHSSTTGSFLQGKQV